MTLGAFILRLWLSRRILKIYKEKTITHVDSSCWFTMGRSWKTKPPWQRTRWLRMVFLLSCLARYVLLDSVNFLEIMCSWFFSYSEFTMYFCNNFACIAVICVLIILEVWRKSGDFQRLFSFLWDCALRCVIFYVPGWEIYVKSLKMLLDFGYWWYPIRWISNFLYQVTAKYSWLS